ncbi:TPA: hypothetical protein ACLBIT_000254, partial [Neisseria meningitidis]
PASRSLHHTNRVRSYHILPAGGTNFKTDVQVKTYKDACGTHAFCCSHHCFELYIETSLAALS